MAGQSAARSRSDLLRPGAPGALARRLMARFEAGPIERHHLGPLVETASHSIPLVAGRAVAERVYDHDPRSFWGLRRRGSDPLEPPAGVTAILLLSRTGLDDLLAGTLDYAAPQLEALVDRNSPPLAIYIWAMIAPGIISGALYSLFQQMNVLPYMAADIYWRPLTAAGSRLTKPFGFRLAAPGGRVSNLYVLPRKPTSES